jgi:fumarate reductase subunit D
MVKSPKANDPVVLDGKIMAVLSYLSVLCIIPLLFKKDNSFILHHGRQGLVLFIAQVAVFIIHIIFGPFILKLGNFILLTMSFVGIIMVIKGEYYELPVVYNIARKITL